MRRPVVGVMGGSKASEDVATMAEELGKLIAQRGWILLNGGRNTGVMAASARGAKRAGGTVIGILPGKDAKKAAPDLDIAVVTGMIADGRNLINVLSSDIVIACPGRLGTMSEVVLALNARKPVILLEWEAWAQLEPYVRKGQLTLAANPTEAVDRTSAFLATR